MTLQALLFATVFLSNISHDLNFVSLFAQKILVMHGGRIVEEVLPQKLEESRHPATMALLEASRKLNIALGK